MEITVVDYGMGNIGSIANMLKRVGVPCRMAANPGDLASAQKIILPGVGSFGQGMKELGARGFLPVLRQKVLSEKTPVLGICLGMQLFSKFSEEGGIEGLGWLDAWTVRFNPPPGETGFRIPHMGWSEVRPRPDNPLIAPEDTVPRFYFLHSYHLKCEDPADVAATALYGGEFTAMVRRKNLFGVQFHPEKSHRFGMRLFERFAGI